MFGNFLGNSVYDKRHSTDMQKERGRHTDAPPVPVVQRYSNSRATNQEEMGIDEPVVPQPNIDTMPRTSPQQSLHAQQQFGGDTSSTSNSPVDATTHAPHHCDNQTKATTPKGNLHNPRAQTLSGNKRTHVQMSGQPDPVSPKSPPPHARPDRATPPRASEEVIVSPTTPSGGPQRLDQLRTPVSTTSREYMDSLQAAVLDLMELQDHFQFTQQDTDAEKKDPPPNK
eukprot:c18332_g1_i1.p1 GENE.c18332_g1_i1~~c18332_g1_i1.p1  ORF type:complete len:227 (+),score=19.58 c18332_g1_i1:437-1117(+)